MGGRGAAEKRDHPELAETLSQSQGTVRIPIGFQKISRAGNSSFWRPGSRTAAGGDAAGVFGVQLDSEYLVESVLPEALGNAQLNEGAEVILAIWPAVLCLGKRYIDGTPPGDGIFRRQLPPLEVELFQASAKGLETLDLRRNFFFWTILTLIVVLAFGPSSWSGLSPTRWRSSR